MHICCTDFSQTSDSGWSCMMLAGFLFLLLLTDGESSNSSCSYHNVLKHLKLNDNKLYTMTRPVSDHRSSLEVVLDILIYAILDVNEKHQKFVSYIWVDMSWKDDYISWNPDEFCGITTLIVPTKVLWKPDLTIEEMTEKDKASESPYLFVSYEGRVGLRDDMMVGSTCNMYVHKFPFDVQSCNLSFKSIIHKVEEMHFVPFRASSKTTEWSRHMMQTQSEWLLINMEVYNKTNNNFDLNQSIMVCTITMKRRSVLYIVNFMLPVLFFLCLDLASFLISESGGEKLSFKVTVLLAVTVMQLILNEILPSSSDKIPLIAVYCIGVFSLMMISLLETILVMYLIERDSKEADKDQCLREVCGGKRDKVHNCFRDVRNCTHCACDVSPGETPSELLPVAKEGNSSQLTEEARDFEKLSDELREVVKTLAVLLNEKNYEGNLGYWAIMTKTINRVFLIFYFIAVCLFLCWMFFSWNSTEE